jgi:hypothetical protein
MHKQPAAIIPVAAEIIGHREPNNALAHIGAIAIPIPLVDVSTPEAFPWLLGQR